MNLLLDGAKLTEVVSGAANGVDQAGERWALFRGVEVRTFPAEWSKHGRSAGPIRNRAMASYADAALIFWDGRSRGTANMVTQMLAAKKLVRVVRCGAQPR